ncbi:hypothetical protein VNI00_018976, partial [Paramarasmius palmivorus]
MRIPGVWSSPTYILAPEVKHLLVDKLPKEWNHPQPTGSQGPFIIASDPEFDYLTHLHTAYDQLALDSSPCKQLLKALYDSVSESPEDVGVPKLAAIRENKASVQVQLKRSLNNDVHGPRIKMLVFVKLSPSQAALSGNQLSCSDTQHLNDLGLMIYV